MNRLIAAAGVLSATICLSAQTPARSWLDATPLVERATVRPGDTVRLALQARVAPGFHIQSDRPREPSLIPTAVAIDAPPGITGTEVVFPAATEFSLPGYSQPLLVFEGDFPIGVVLRVAKDHPAERVTVPVHVRYQACNDTQCFRPVVFDTSWTFRIGQDTRAAAAEHADVFRTIAFGHGRPPSTGFGALSPAPPAAANGASGDPLALFDTFTIAAKSDGYSTASQFLRFIQDAESGVTHKGMFEGRGPLAVLTIVFLGGLALNLTPCVLPMIPINLAIIGAGSQRSGRGRGFLLGGVYGAAMALVYGLLGVIVILTAGTFGTINASPWFNAAIAALFVVLGLAMFDVISIDFSRLSSRFRFEGQSRGSMLLAFSMGAVAALLAGACVAPVVVQVVVFSSQLYATGTPIALGLPFFLGIGMAVPWPIAGAGLASLPKPGAWMVRVKQVLGVFILATAAYYGYLTYELMSSRWVDPASVKASVDAQLRAGWHASIVEGLQTAREKNTPVLIDFWATWCKNCLTMDETTLKDPAVTSALAGYTKIKFEAEDPEASPARELLQKVGGVGLPTYVILRPR